MAVNTSSQPAPAAAASPYRLRMEHEGLLSLKLEGPGPILRFDPRQPPDDDDLVVLTWDWPEHLHATAEAFRQGRRPIVIAPEPVLTWLVDQGAPRQLLRDPPATVAGLTVETWSYTPIPYADPPEAMRKIRSVLLRPDRALRRLKLKSGLPTSQPQVVQLTLPDGGRLVHLNLSLHGGTPTTWLDTMAARLHGADWLLLGSDFGEQAATAALLPRFGAARILLVDLLGEVRRSIGMPTELLTPLVDRLRGEGLDAYVFASQVSYRFER